MRTVLTVLTVLSGVFAVQSFAWAVMAVKARIRVVSQHQALGKLLSAHNAGKSPDMAVDVIAAQTAAGARSADWGDIATIGQYVEVAILRDAAKNLRGPALLALLAVVLGTVSAVWGFWI